MVEHSGYPNVCACWGGWEVWGEGRGALCPLRTLDPGRRFLPLEFGTMRGVPSASKNVFLRVEARTMCSGGGPRISMMHSSCSVSFSPGNSGYLGQDAFAHTHTG